MASRSSQGFSRFQKMVTDKVHGNIKLPDYIQIIINTEQFQRLRNISQLGMVRFMRTDAIGYFRYEHSIGTFHLASQLIKQIQNQLKQEGSKIKVTDEEVKCVEIAALCHDLGHGPYSHFWEQLFDGIQLEGNEAITPRKHEELTAEIFEKYIYSNGSVKGNMKKHKLNEEHVELIKYMITGDKKLISSGKSSKIDEIEEKKKYFLFEIVANKKSGLDVDKFDYLCRDSIYLELPDKIKIDVIKRIMNSIRVAEEEEPDKHEGKGWHLAVRDQKKDDINDVFYYQYFLHRDVYQHKIVKGVECMFKKAIKEIVESDVIRKEFIRNVMGDNVKPIENVFFSAEFISKASEDDVWGIMKKYTRGIIEKSKTIDAIEIHCRIEVIRKENVSIKNIMESVESLSNDFDKLNELQSMLKELKVKLDEPANVDKYKDFNDMIYELLVILEHISLRDYLNYLKELKSVLQAIYTLTEQLQIKSLKSEQIKELLENLNNLQEIYKSISTPAKYLNANLNKLHKIRNDISSCKEFYEILESESAIDDSIAERLDRVIDQLNRFPRVLVNISNPGKDLIETLKDSFGDSNENMKSVREKLGVLPDYLIFNGDIRDDMESLIDILKQINPVADVTSSEFSLQSENREGNPLLAVRFYKESDKSKCLHLKKEDVAHLKELISNQFIMIIFTKDEKHNRDSKLLDEIIEILCSDCPDEERFNRLNIDKEEMKALRKKYKFRKNKYY